MFAVPHEDLVDVYSIKSLQLKFSLRFNPGEVISSINISANFQYLVLLINKSNRNNVLIYDILHRKYHNQFLDVESKIPEIKRIYQINISSDNTVLVLHTLMIDGSKAIFLDINSFKVIGIVKVPYNLLYFKLAPLESAFYIINERVLMKISYTGEVLAKLENILVDTYGFFKDGSLMTFSRGNPSTQITHIHKISSDLNNIESSKKLDLFPGNYYDLLYLRFTSDKTEFYYHIGIGNRETWIYSIETLKLTKHEISVEPNRYGCSVLKVTRDFLIVINSGQIGYWISRNDPSKIKIFDFPAETEYNKIPFRENLCLEKILNLLPGIRVLHSLQRAYDNILSPDNITVMIENLLASLILVSDTQLLLLANFLRRYTSREEDEELNLLRSNKEALEDKLLELMEI